MRTAAAQDKADEEADAAAAAAAVKSANDAARSDLEMLAHALQLKSANYLLAKPKARAGDVAVRAARRTGAEFMGGMTAVLFAAREGHMDAVRALVEGGADVNIANGDKFTPLVIAIVNGHYDVAQYLVDHGADPNLASVSGLYSTLCSDRCAVGAARVVPAAEYRAGEDRLSGPDEIAHRAQGQRQRADQRQAVVPQLHQRLHLGRFLFSSDCFKSWLMRWRLASASSGASGVLATLRVRRGERLFQVRRRNTHSFIRSMVGYMIVSA